jgi:hypothetical protein
MPTSPQHNSYLIIFQRGISAGVGKSRPERARLPVVSAGAIHFISLQVLAVYLLRDNLPFQGSLLSHALLNFFPATCKTHVDDIINPQLSQVECLSLTAEIAA